MRRAAVLHAVVFCLVLSQPCRAQHAGGALLLDGNGDYLSFSVPGGQVPSAALTVEAWVKFHQFGKNTIFNSRKGNTRENSVRLIYHDRMFKGGINLELTLLDGKSYKVHFPFTRKELNRWYHIAGTYDGRKMRMFLDGQQVAQSVAEGLIQFAGNTSWHVGADDDVSSFDEFFKGEIDDVRIWSRAVPPAELRDNMGRELTGNERDLLIYFNFNQSRSASFVNDISGGPSPGVLRGNATLIPSTAPLKPPEPPELSVEAVLLDKVLKANSTGAIEVTVRNTGRGDAGEVEVSVTSNYPGVTVPTPAKIGSIASGSLETVTLTIVGEESLPSGRIPLTISARDEEGHSAESPLDLTAKALFSRPAYPADLVVSDVGFHEPSGNRALDAYEKGEIRFVLRNRGRGEAQNIRISLTPLLPDEGIDYASSQSIDRLEPEEERAVRFELTGAPRVETLPRKFRLQVAEEFGFNADPALIGFETKAYDPPDLRIEKVAINDGNEGDAYGNGNSIIEPGESIEVTAFVQNHGIGTAENVTARVVLGTSDPNIGCPEAGKTVPLGRVEPGDFKKFKFYFYTSKRYDRTEMPLSVAIEEERGLYGKTIDLGLRLGESTPNIVDVQVARVEPRALELKAIPEATQSDVDDPPRQSRTRRPEGLAVIVGIEKYRYAPDVTYAARDAGAFYNTATSVLGIPDRNIVLACDDAATKGEFERLFSKDGWISRRVTARSDVFVYYSGHGAPDIETKKAYLIPCDTDPNYANKGYSLDDLYSNLTGLEANSVTVILDACFAGQSREEEVLLKDARPIVPVRRDPLAYEGLTVFAAAKGSQISSSYPPERHGLFTYFFLKGVQGEGDVDGDGVIAIGELFDYLKRTVPRAAGDMDREQMPTLDTSDRNRGIAAY